MEDGEPYCEKGSVRMEYLLYMTFPGSKGSGVYLTILLTRIVFCDFVTSDYNLYALIIRFTYLFLPTAILYLLYCYWTG